MPNIPVPSVPYSWIEIGLWTQWRRDHSSILLCCISDPQRTGLQQRVQERVLRNCFEPAAGPHGWFLLILPIITNAYDQAVWKCRNMIRPYEKARPDVHNPNANYAELYELVRHVLHSTETLAMSLEVLEHILSDIQELRDL